MRNIRVFVLFAMIVSLSSTAVWAVGRQTVDPNSSGSVAAAGDTGSNVGFDKAVSYSARHRMLYQIVDDLSKLTDTKLYTGRSSLDWRTRELRMNIAAKDVPLKDLMRSIARVLRLKLTRSTVDGKPVYRLTGEVVKEEETLEEKAARQLAKRRSIYFAQVMGLARAGQREIDRLKDADPKLYEFARSPYGVPLARFLADVPAASMALVGGKQLLLRAGDMPSTAISDLLPALQQAPAQPTIRPQDSRVLTPRGVPPSAEAMVVEINPGGSHGGSESLGQIKITCNGRVVPFSFADPAPASASAQDESELAPVKPKPEIKPNPVVDHSDEPDLHKKVKLAIKDSPAALDTVQSALTDASGFAVVSDSYDDPSPTIDVPRDETELLTLLNSISTAGGQNWEKHTGIVEMRDRSWASKREKMVSQAEQQKETKQSAPVEHLRCGNP